MVSAVPVNKLALRVGFRHGNFRLSIDFFSFVRLLSLKSLKSPCSLYHRNTSSECMGFPQIIRIIIHPHVKSCGSIFTIPAFIGVGGLFRLAVWLWFRNYRFDLFDKILQIIFDNCPNNFIVYPEIVMHNSASETSDSVPFFFWIHYPEIRFYSFGCFTNNFKISDNSVYCFIIFQKWIKDRFVVYRFIFNADSSISSRRNIRSRLDIS